MIHPPCLRTSLHAALTAVYGSTLHFVDVTLDGTVPYGMNAYAQDQALLSPTLACLQTHLPEALQPGETEASLQTRCAQEYQVLAEMEATLLRPGTDLRSLLDTHIKVHGHRQHFTFTLS
ncbi:hypothetical protein [Deinococcus sp. Leaf326]|uniref:hypothetical protein n=1 Tax=Deinococcus sp. Leaf326 TaxID=1736338 RepID=UPI0006FBD095|nr:hypothetical protein [Deinococcus sp. Leaf326]KQR18797.1 hypothetical protein ASF71_19900 [Deinococcus sp. Leaf326]